MDIAFEIGSFVGRRFSSAKLYVVDIITDTPLGVDTVLEENYGYHTNYQSTHSSWGQLSVAVFAYIEDDTLKFSSWSYGADNGSTDKFLPDYWFAPISPLETLASLSVIDEIEELLSLKGIKPTLPAI